MNCGLRLARAGSLAGRTSPSRLLDVTAFRDWLVNKAYTATYIKNVMPYAIKYNHLIHSNNLRELDSLSGHVRTHVLKALTAISKFLGIYTQFKDRLRANGIKWHHTDALTAFLRILNANNKNTLQWLNQTLPYLRENEQLFARFLQLSGLRVSEGIASFNLCIRLAKENRLQEYYDKNLNVLCHFKYPKLFIRRSKCAFITFIKPEFLTAICNSQTVTYPSIRKRLEHNKIPLRFNELRDIFGTHLVNNGILEIEQNLVCGRIPVSIFIRHYWSPRLKELGIRIFKALETVDVLQQQPTIATP